MSHLSLNDKWNPNISRFSRCDCHRYGRLSNDGSRNWNFPGYTGRSLSQVWLTRRFAHASKSRSRLSGSLTIGKSNSIGRFHWKSRRRAAHRPRYDDLPGR